MNSNLNNIPILKRPHFFNGQRLTAADLAAVQNFHRELRWLHNRSLHSWGIASGYQVSGNKGDRTVRIAPGYAIDSQGRDLIQSEPSEIPIPAVAGDSSGRPATYYLTASYQEDGKLTCQTRSGTCGTLGAVRCPEQAKIEWQEPKNIRRGENVVLAKCEIQNCQLLTLTASEERAIPAQQPYVATGQTEPGKTDWELWKEDEQTLGVKVNVPTNGAGFRTTPKYQAHVVGERFFDDEIDGQKRCFVVDGYVQVDRCSASALQVRVILPWRFTEGKSDVVTPTDYRSIIHAIATRVARTITLQHELNRPLVESTLEEHIAEAVENQRILVDPKKWHVQFTIPDEEEPIRAEFTVSPEDFQEVIKTIATRNGISDADLLRFNNLNGADVVTPTDYRSIIHAIATRVARTITLQHESNRPLVESTLEEHIAEAVKNQRILVDPGISNRPLVESTLEEHIAEAVKNQRILVDPKKWHVQFTIPDEEEPIRAEFTVSPEDFQEVIKTIATRNGISDADLLRFNSLYREDMSIAIGDRLLTVEMSIAIDDRFFISEPLPLNPPNDVFTNDFLKKLQTMLKWYVVWMGVEG